MREPAQDNLVIVLAIVFMMLNYNKLSYFVSRKRYQYYRCPESLMLVHNVPGVLLVFTSPEHPVKTTLVIRMSLRQIKK